MQWQQFLRVSMYRYRNRHSAPSVSLSAARHPSADSASHATATLTLWDSMGRQRGVRCQKSDTSKTTLPIWVKPHSSNP